MERGDHCTALFSLNWAWSSLGRVGLMVISACREVVCLASVMWVVTTFTVQPRRWRKTIRQVFALHLFRMGVNTIIPVGLVACLVGILAVMQAHLWLGKVGQTGWLGPLLVVVVIRELAPLLTNLVMIIRNGSETTVELVNMTQTGKVRMLDAQGIDPLVYLVMPRVLAMVVSTLCLTLLFVIASFVSGYLFSFALGLRVLAPGIFLEQVLRAIRSEDVLNLLVKSVFPALLTSLICCSEGLNVPAASTAGPVATRRALWHSVAGLFLISVPVSVLTYL